MLRFWNWQALKRGGSIGWPGTPLGSSDTLCLVTEEGDHFMVGRGMLPFGIGRLLKRG
jgi:hypothetical protein